MDPPLLNFGYDCVRIMFGSAVVKKKKKKKASEVFKHIIYNL